MTHFTLVNLEILTVLRGNFYYDTVTLKLIEGKIQGKFNLQEYHFVYFYDVIINCYPNFITFLYFTLALIN